MAVDCAVSLAGTALHRLQASYVVALSQFSIALGVLAAVFVLREPAGPLRILAAGVIVGGAGGVGVRRNEETDRKDVDNDRLARGADWNWTDSRQHTIRSTGSSPG